MKNSLYSCFKNKSLYIFLVFVLIIGIVSAGCSENKKPDIISDIEGTKGYVRTVSGEKKEFYSGRSFDNNHNRKPVEAFNI